MVSAIESSSTSDLYSRWSVLLNTQTSGSAAGVTQDLETILEEMRKKSALEHGATLASGQQQTSTTASVTAQNQTKQVAPIEALRSLSTGEVELAYAFQDVWYHVNQLRGLQAYAENNP